MSVLTVLLLLPLGPAVPQGAAAESTATGVTSTFKTSVSQRLTRAARSAPAPARAPAPALSAPTYSDRVLSLTNAERTSRGLRPLGLSPCADGFADSWATSLSLRGSLAHQPLAPVLTACHASRVGENVGYGNLSAEQLVAMWMASAGHRANLLNGAYTHLGVGAVGTAGGRVYGVQVFVSL